MIKFLILFLICFFKNFKTHTHHTRVESNTNLLIPKNLYAWVFITVISPKERFILICVYLTAPLVFPSVRGYLNQFIIIKGLIDPNNQS